jgi:hypothetical protein
MKIRQIIQWLKRDDVSKWGRHAVVAGVFLLVYTWLLTWAVKCCDEDTPLPETVIKWKKEYVPMPAETIRVQLPSKIDTVTVVREYFTKKVYRDTIFSNDTVELVVSDTVYKNALGDRKVSLTFNASRFVKTNSVGIEGLIGYREADLLAVFRHKRWQLAGGWNFVEKGPVIGVGYTLVEW